MTDVLVIVYHAVSARWPAKLAVRPERLESQLMLLARRGFRGATFHDAVHARPFARTVAVTFDDAYRSVLDFAFPILERVGFPGTVFVPTNYPDQEGPMSWPGIDRWLGGPYEDELQPLDWSQLRTLAAAGWEIGSHTCSHSRLTQLSDTALEGELSESRSRCEYELGGTCTSLAYPYGAHDRRVVEAARRVGYQTACTVPDRLASVDRLTWPRVGVWVDDGPLAFRLKVSPAMRHVRSTPAADALLPLFRRRLFRRAREVGDGRA